ncbi:hypothetical protein Rcas_1340 [Roseiflexus castenholzii DSM 13941]|uniref:Uncharacterized protein n=2 Tax=Roseiflexus castenholzii TaxID=120962 RepID=A7NIX8_ROSCS|nr:hypothetical protein Rcas_1340 [Roseiflexus castenholzii DSM 13941]
MGCLIVDVRTPTRLDASAPPCPAWYHMHAGDVQCRRVLHAIAVAETSLADDQLEKVPRPARAPAMAAGLSKFGSSMRQVDY